jgi:hypothetical protein
MNERVRAMTFDTDSLGMDVHYDGTDMLGRDRKDKPCWAAKIIKVESAEEATLRVFVPAGGSAGDFNVSIVPPSDTSRCSWHVRMECPKRSPKPPERIPL